MADDELLDDDELEVEEGAEDIDADLEDDLDDGDLDDELGGEEVADDLEGGDDDEGEDESEDEEPASPKARNEDEDDDEDDLNPDDVEEDLDTILRDRIAAGADEDDDEDEEAPVDDRSEGGDRVAPRAAEEFSCSECFLLVRRSQFSVKRTDCPGGLDGDDCPVKHELGLV